MKKRYSNCFQLQTTLMSKILNGDYPSGSSLPSVEQLKEDFQVSAATVKRAFDGLADCGLIRRRNGRSPVVADLTDIHKYNRQDFGQVIIVRDNVKGGLFFRYESAPWTWTLQELLYSHFMSEHIPIITIGKNDVLNNSPLLNVAAGVIYVSSVVDPEVVQTLQNQDVPFVVLCGNYENPLDYNMAYYDYSNAMERLAVYLLSNGVKKVDLFGADWVDSRHQPLLNLLYANNISPEDVELQILPFNSMPDEIESRYRNLPEELKGKLGIVCYSDLHASMLLNILTQANWRPKKDFTLAALGNLLGAGTISHFELKMEQLVEKALKLFYIRCQTRNDVPSCAVKLDFIISNT